MTTEPIPEIPATPKFKRGDVVRLNSGGPAMTVADRYENSGPVYNCWWFVPHLEVTNAEFPEAYLTLVPEPKEELPPVAPDQGFQVYRGENCLRGVPAGTCVWHDIDKAWSAPFKTGYDNVLPNCWFAIPAQP